MRVLEFTQLLLIYPNFSNFTETLMKLLHFAQIYFSAIGFI